MQEYTAFAGVYDLLMDDIDYPCWASRIHSILTESRAKSLLDLGCGTGTMSVELAKLHSYDIVAVDNSADMLSIAQQKACEADVDILFLHQDMRRLDLFGTVDAAICTCDALNYILTEDELCEVFRRARLFLNPGGVFIFDMNTEYKFKEALGNRVFGEDKDGIVCEWENRYDPATGINVYHLSIAANGESTEEIHKQRAYDPAKVANLLMNAGFAGVKIFDEYTEGMIHAKSTRISFIATAAGGYSSCGSAAI